MSLIKRTLLTVIAVTCVGSTTSAQCHDSRGGHGSNHRFVPVTYSITHYGYPGVRFGTYGTYDGYLHGKADVIRARGDANLTNAQAWTQAERARRLQMENSVAALQTRLERKRINRESRFGHLYQRGAVRKATITNSIVDPDHDDKNPFEQGLSHQELDPITGALRWPLLLRSSYFAKARRPVDQSFTDRARSGSVRADHYLPLRNWIEKIQVELDKHVSRIPPEDFAESQDFLRRMQAELRLDHSPQAIAQTLVNN